MEGDEIVQDWVTPDVVTSTNGVRLSNTVVISIFNRASILVRGVAYCKYKHVEFVHYPNRPAHALSHCCQHLNRFFSYNLVLMWILQSVNLGLPDRTNGFLLAFLQDFFKNLYVTVLYSSYWCW